MKRAGSRTGAGDRTQVWRLGRDETLRLPSGRGALVAQVECGRVVVTQAGDLVDHVLEGGEAVTLPRGGLAVAWALTPSVLVVRGAERGFAARVPAVAA